MRLSILGKSPSLELFVDRMNEGFGGGLSLVRI
jgi:hypothetical protein